MSSTVVMSELKIATKVVVLPTLWIMSASMLALVDTGALQTVAIGLLKIEYSTLMAAWWRPWQVDRHAVVGLTRVGIASDVTEASR